jgi:hypothetical protein
MGTGLFDKNEGQFSCIGTSVGCTGSIAARLPGMVRWASKHQGDRHRLLAETSLLLQELAKSGITDGSELEESNNEESSSTVIDVEGK